MAKKKINERKQAQALYMSGDKSQKDIADIIGVTEKTIGRWAKESAWDTERNARLMMNDNVKRNGKKAMDNNFQRMLELQAQRKEEEEKPEPDKAVIEALDKSILGYMHAVAQAGGQVNKIIEGNPITLTIYLQVMDDIFNTLKLEEPKIYNESLDFQERHIQFIAKKLG